jgi:hypothetical protein
MPHARKDLIDVEEICKYIIDPDAYITSSANKQDLKAILNRRAGGIPPVSLMLAGKNRSMAQGRISRLKSPGPPWFFGTGRSRTGTRKLHRQMTRYTDGLT